MPETPRLFGLLVAINEYPDPVRPLNGCVNDIRKVKTYLEEKQKALTPKLKVLENADATKQNIVDGFRKHLSQAGEGDTALVYFAGHGCQEEADTDIWRYELDGKLECIVTYDGIQEGPNGEIITNMIANKELRYLLHELERTKAHIITIFDCCHSGGNTRSVDVDGEKKEMRRVESRLSASCPQRNWEQFIFSDTISREDLKTKPIGEVMPVGQHVQMGACHSDQEAFEVDGGGIFTNTLLKLLNDVKGEISYFDLRSRIRYKVKTAYKQTPQVYAQGENAQQMFSGFLGVPITRSENKGNVVYNPNEKWTLDLGAMHGVSPELDNVTIEDNDGNEITTAKVVALEMSSTKLAIADESKLDQAQGYFATVPGALAQPIRIFIPEDEAGKEGGTILRKELEGLSDRLILSDSEQESDYAINTQNDTYHITPPFEPDRPVVKQIKDLTTKSAKTIKGFLRNMAKWHFVRDLYNPNVKIFQKSPIKIEFFEVQDDGSETLLELNGEELLFPYKKQADGNWGNKLRVKITNMHTKGLWLSLVYLGEDYWVYSSLMGEPTVFLEPKGKGQPAWAYGGQALPFNLAPHIVDFNWPNSMNWLKFIVSTTEFDPAIFDQDALPMPGMEEESHRALALPPKPAVDDWTTSLVRIRMPNPEFKPEN